MRAERKKPRPVRKRTCVKMRMGRYSRVGLKFGRRKIMNKSKAGIERAKLIMFANTTDSGSISRGK